MPSRVAIDRDRISAVCRRRHVKSLALFGSVLRDDFRPDSDVDVLVEFQPDRAVGFEIFDIEDELSRLLGCRKVDLVNRKYLNPRLRDRILAEVETLHEG
jgi:predicted nucleotidyltransferase